MYQLLNSPTKSHYTYILLDPITNLPFYVGKGTGTRYLDHFKEAITGKTHNKLKIAIIKKLIRENNIIPIQIVFESENENECYDEEKRLIGFYGKRINKTGLLANLTDGGEGGSWSHTDAHKQKLRVDNPGGKATSKPIYQIDTQGNVVNKWSSSRQAAIALGIKSWRNVSQAASKHKQRVVGGFYWRWIGDSDVVENRLQNIDALNRKRTKIKHRIQVAQINTDGDIVKIWESASDAARQFKLSVSSISAAIKRNGSCAGFIWKRV